MSAMMVDEWTAPQPRLRVVPTTPVGRQAGPKGRSAGPGATRRVPSRLATGPVGCSSPGLARAHATAASGLRLTRRGLALVIGFFLAAMVASVIVTVTTFLAISNDPVGVSW